MSFCPACREPAPCQRCLEPEQSALCHDFAEPSWAIIAVAWAAGLATIVATWTGVLF